MECHFSGLSWLFFLYSLLHKHQPKKKKKKKEKKRKKGSKWGKNSQVWNISGAAEPIEGGI